METITVSDPLLLYELGNRSTNDMPTISPSHEMIARLHTWVIVGVTIVMAIVFVAVYIQLSVVLCYGYKLISYQTIFLFNILLWASFRLTFNSFYFYYCCGLISNISPTSKWFLISFPEILLFLSLALLVHYFMEHLLKVIERNQEVLYLSPSYRRLYCYRFISSVVWATLLILYIVINVTLSYLIFLKEVKEVNTLRIVRVILLEILILIMGTVLGVCMLLIYVTKAGKDIMDARQVSKWQAITISTLLILLFSSRAIYNIVAVFMQQSRKKLISFATDLADFNMDQEGDINFFCVLLLWEVIPICLIVMFFRIRLSNRLLDICSCKTSFTKEVSRHFFHNGAGPSRKWNNNNNNIVNSSVSSDYHKSSYVSIPSLPGQLNQQFSTAGYGSTSRTHCSISSSGYNAPSFMPGTTPPKLFTGSPSLFSDSHVNNNNFGNSND